MDLCLYVLTRYGLYTRFSAQVHRQEVVLVPHAATKTKLLAFVCYCIVVKSRDEKRTRSVFDGHLTGIMCNVRTWSNKRLRIRSRWDLDYAR